MPDFFREIYETAQTVKPGSLVEFCPCGTAYSFFTMPHFNMSVASDPGSSFQVRSKAKTLKALMGDSIPYFGDHVELSDGARRLCFHASGWVVSWVRSLFYPRWRRNEASLI